MHVLRSSCENIKRNIYFFIVVGFMQCLYLIWRTDNELKLAKAFGIKSCIADLFILENGVSFLGIFSMPLILILIFRCERYTLKYEQVIRYEGHKEIWKYQAGRVFIYMFWISFSMLLYAILAGALYQLPMINWTEINSKCFIETGYTTQMSFEAVLLLSAFFMLLKFIILGLTVMFIKWLKLRELFGYVIIAVLAVIEYIPENNLGFYRIFSFDYNKAVYMEYIFWAILTGVSIAGLLYGAGIIYAKKREFINEE